MKNDCRNEPKAGRVILALIARQKTPEKMTALYTKYKESGLTVGELRKKASKPKQLDAPVDLTFVDQFYDRIYTLDSDTLTNSQIDLFLVPSPSRGRLGWGWGWSWQLAEIM